MRAHRLGPLGGVIHIRSPEAARSQENPPKILNFIMEHETVDNLIVSQQFTNHQEVLKIAQDFVGKLDLYRAGFDPIID